MSVWNDWKSYFKHFCFWIRYTVTHIPRFYYFASFVQFSTNINYFGKRTKTPLAQTFLCQIKPTWLPKTPMLQAEETWSAPNQTAASLGGTFSMKTCATATTVCPAKPSQNMSGGTENTFNHAPAQVPNDPIIVVVLKPWGKRIF